MIYNKQNLCSCIDYTNQLLMAMDWNLDNLWLLHINLVVSRKFWILNKLSDCLKLLYLRIVENVGISEVLENL